MRGNFSTNSVKHNLQESFCLLNRKEREGISTFTYSYFEQGCRKKCTRQSRKVLWVVLSALGSSKKSERMARGATDMFSSATGKQQM